MKNTVEINRFLNHIEREKKTIKTELNAKIESLKNDLQKTDSEKTTVSWKLSAEIEKNEKLESELSVLRAQNEKLLSASKLLLPKIRVNIYENSTACTPRFFASGKWWSRETGGLEPEFVAELTSDEIVEVVDFYGKTEIPLMLPKSNRHKKNESLDEMPIDIH